MPTAVVYRRALRRFATSIVFTILDLVVCTLMVHWVAGQNVSPVLLLLIVPLALTLGNMWRHTVADILYIDSAISSAFTEAALQANWIRHIETIARISRVKARSFEPEDSDGYYDGPPLPALLIVFEEHDAIAACFDEESQHMLEGSAEPVFCAVFTLDNAEQCSAAMRAAERFVLVNREVCQLIEELQAWEKDGIENRDRDWRDASLRAA